MNDKLKEDVTKRMMTIMFGALDRFERYFNVKWDRGEKFYIWADGNEVKESDEKFLDDLANLRSKVLSYGNDQIRFMVAEIDERYDVKQRRYKNTFRVDSSYSSAENCKFNEETKRKGVCHD